jgi:Fe-S oxidoreductase
MMDYCTYCPKMCRFSCPVSEITKEETTTPWGKMEMGRWFLDRQVSFSKETALSLYQCSNCLACQEYCEHLNDVPEALGEVRRMAVANWAAPDNVYRVGERFAKNNNPYGMDLSKRIPESSWSAWKNKKAKVVFIPSCHTLYFYPERLKVYFELFKKLNIPQISIYPQPLNCCGEPLRALGFHKEFFELAEVQGELLKNYSFLVSDEAECSFSLKEHYQWKTILAAKPRVFHLLEFLEPYLLHSSYQTQGKVKGRLVFQAPPFLARHLKLSELPRRVLAHVTGFAPMSLSYHGRDTLSTGTDGCYEMVFPEIADQMAQRVLSEIHRRGFKKLLTASAKAEAQLKRLAPELEIQDIYEFLNEQIL